MSMKCFVIMGFGQKVDYTTGRTLDLDKTYRNIIKPAVEDAGLECIRADDVMHSGMIDRPMYEFLLTADVVVADLSTANANVLYQLGVRHALRPSATIVIAEKHFKFPFDLGHVLIRPYEHLGSGIDYEEAERMRGELSRAIQATLTRSEVDSPVYTFLPALQSAHVQAVQAPSQAAVAPRTEVTPDDNLTALIETFQEARRAGNWSAAVAILGKLLEMRPDDTYLKQQLALATYKSRRPDAATSLATAKGILEQLQPGTSQDPETLGLWAAVHRRLWDVGKSRSDLDEAIWAFEKGFSLRGDYNNGSNLAYLLNVRASLSSPREAIADTVIAERVRRQVVVACETRLRESIKDEQGRPDAHESFWVKAALVEALVGLGESARADATKANALAEAPEAWMVQAMDDQLARLQGLLAMTPVS